MLNFRSVFRLAFLIPAGILAISGCGSEKALEDDNTLRIERAYMVQPAGNAPSVLYMTILNGTDKIDTLLGVSSPVSDIIELHEDVKHQSADGDMPVEMVHMVEREMLEIPARGQVHLSPGGFHIMIMHPKHPITAGDSIDINLNFANFGVISRKAAVITYSDVDTAVTRER